MGGNFNSRGGGQKFQKRQWRGVTIRHPGVVSPLRLGKGVIPLLFQELRFIVISNIFRNNLSPKAQIFEKCASLEKNFSFQNLMFEEHNHFKAQVCIFYTAMNNNPPPSNVNFSSPWQNCKKNR